MYKVACAKCNGHGTIPMFQHQDMGVCYDCMGRGYSLRKTKPSDKFRFQITAIALECRIRKLAMNIEATSEKTAMSKAKRTLSPDLQFGWDLDSIEVIKI